jgi:hypothetical protein
VNVLGITDHMIFFKRSDRYAVCRVPSRALPSTSPGPAKLVFSGNRVVSLRNLHGLSGKVKSFDGADPSGYVSDCLNDAYFAYC